MKKIILALLVLIFIVGCDVPFIGMSTAEEKIEITNVDLISKLREGELITSEDISVKGLSIGASEDDIEEILGAPDIRNTDYLMEGIINLEYGESLGYNGTALLFHLEDDKVTRITILKPFNEELVGLTKIGKEKAEVYAYLGGPERIDRMTKGPKVEFKTLVYPNGIEVILKGNGPEDRLSFVK